MSQAATTQPATATSGAAANIINEVQARITQGNRDITEKMSVGFLELKLKQDEMIQRMQVLEGLVANSKKTPAKKQTAETVTVEGAAEGVTTEAPKAKATFANNRPAWFTGRYKTEAGFKEKYVTAEIATLMEAVTEITSKKDAPRQNAEAKWVLNYLRDHKKAIYDELELEFQKAKTAHLSANKPAQQTAETTTPPNEKTEVVV